MGQIVNKIDSDIYEAIFPTDSGKAEAETFVKELNDVFNSSEGKVLVLTNLENLDKMPPNDALKIITSSIRHNKKHIQKSAICGLNKVLSALVKGMLMIAGRLDIQIFHKREYALKWLVQAEGDLNVDVVEVALNWLKTSETKAEETPLIPKIDKENPHILIIEDNISILEIYKRICEKQFNAKVYTAENGIDGIDVLNDYPVDLVLCDLMLPEMSGFEVIKKTRKIVRHQETPIIIISAIADKQDVIKGISSGANDYIVKPASLKLLKEKISHYI